jgi:hypothetical protein
MVRVVDKTGVVRLQRNNAEVHSSTLKTSRAIWNLSLQTDGFRRCRTRSARRSLLVGARIVNLSGLAELEQAIALAQTELENLPPDEKLVIVAARAFKLILMKEFETDILIVGGGVGGCAAALAAASSGLRVVLTEESDWIGGQLTSQATPPDEHGWIEEFGCTRSYRKCAKRGQRILQKKLSADRKSESESVFKSRRRLGFAALRRAESFLKVLEAMLAEYVQKGNLRILTEHFPVAADTEANEVRAVTLRNCKTAKNDDFGQNILLTRPNSASCFR